MVAPNKTHYTQHPAKLIGTQCLKPLNPWNLIPSGASVRNRVPNSRPMTPSVNPLKPTNL